MRNQDSLVKWIKILLSYETLGAVSINDYMSSIEVPISSYVNGTILTHLMQGLKELDTSLKLEHWMPPRMGNTIMYIILLITKDKEEIFKINECRVTIEAHYL